MKLIIPAVIAIVSGARQSSNSLNSDNVGSTDLSIPKEKPKKIELKFTSPFAQAFRNRAFDAETNEDWDVSLHTLQNEENERVRRVNAGLDAIDAERERQRNNPFWYLENNSLSLYSGGDEDENSDESAEATEKDPDAMAVDVIDTIQSNNFKNFLVSLKNFYDDFQEMEEENKKLTAQLDAFKQYSHL
jgi:hypothetical protein